ncbi:MAG: IRE (iron responsive element), partial [Pirellulaceae bacterium]
MNQNSPIIRKVVYLSAIAVLMLPLYWLGQPASYSEDRTPEGGGQLALLRMENQLSQAELGEIDPTSESMKLATLGLRGPAANFLWNKAMKYQRRKNWDALSATVQQIIRLQPNFLGVWEFQSHNLTYNVSVDFDDYRHRYTWVKKGIDFLCIGNRYNHDEPRLLHYTGWFIGQKIGIADEHVEFRELFRNDQDYHDVLRKAMRDFEHDMDSQDASGRHDRTPDNWLVGRLWYLQAVRAVDSLGKSIRKKSPLVFHADPAKSR